MQLHKTQNCSKQVVKVINNYNLSTIRLTIKTYEFIATSYKQRATNCNFKYVHSQFMIINNN